MHIWIKLQHYILINKSIISKHKGISKKSMSKMVTNTYMLFLKGFLLNNLIDRSLLSEQEAKKLAM